LRSTPSHIHRRLPLSMYEITKLSIGDLILFCGRTPIHLRIQEVTGCPWTQVALLLRHSNDPQPLVFESTKMSASLDIKTGSILRGVQLGRLSDRLSSFDGTVAVRELRPPLSDRQAEALLAFAEQVHGRPFNDSKRVAVGALRRKNHPSDGSSFYCSELVAEAYQRMGLLPTPPRGLTSNNYIPADFSSTYSSPPLPLEAGVYLEAERILIWPPP